MSGPTAPTRVTCCALCAVRPDAPGALCPHCGLPAYCSSACAGAAAQRPGAIRPHHAWLCALMIGARKRRRREFEEEEEDDDGAAMDTSGTEDARPVRRFRPAAGPVPVFPPPGADRAPRGTRKRVLLTGGGDGGDPKRLQRLGPSPDVVADWINVDSPVWQDLAPAVRVQQFGEQWPAEAAALYYRHERAVANLLNLKQNRRLLLYTSAQIPRVLRSYLRWFGLSMLDLVRDWARPVDPARPNDWMPLYVLLTRLWPVSAERPFISVTAEQAITSRAGYDARLVAILRRVGLLPGGERIRRVPAAPPFVLAVGGRDWWPTAENSPGAETRPVLATAADESRRQYWAHVLFLSAQVHAPLQAHLLAENWDLPALLEDYADRMVATRMTWLNMFNVVAKHLRPHVTRSQRERFLMLPLRRYVTTVAGPESRLMRAVQAAGLVPVETAG